MKAKSIRSAAKEIDSEIQATGNGITRTMTPDGDIAIQANQTSTIRTFEALLDACQIDTDAFEVSRGEVNKWEVMSDKSGLTPLFQVKAKVTRKALTREEVLKSFQIADKAYRNYPKLPKASPVPASGKGTMVEFALPDLHLGKLAWTRETSHGNWNVDRACVAWENAIDDLITRSPLAEEAWFIVGNDFFNVDNQDETTTGGTPQDEDGRWAQTFQRGVELLHQTTAKLLQKFPKVRLIVVPGNHDSQRAWYLGAALEEYWNGYYRAKSKFLKKEIKDEDREVVIDNTPNFRKYYQWGRTGIAFAHGDRLKKMELGHLCANEARDIWAKVDSFEFHLGHLHQNMVQGIGGVTVRWLPALCPPDAWHAKSGYTMSEKAAQLFVYDQSGLTGTLIHRPDKAIFE